MYPFRRVMYDYLFRRVIYDSHIMKTFKNRRSFYLLFIGGRYLTI